MIDTTTLFQPHEMTWSTHEFNKQNNLDWLEEKQEERLNDILFEDQMKELRYKEHKMRILKEDYPEKYADVELKSAEQMMEELMEGDERSSRMTPGHLTDEIDRRLN